MRVGCHQRFLCARYSACSDIQPQMHETSAISPIIVQRRKNQAARLIKPDASGPTPSTRAKVSRVSSPGTPISYSIGWMGRGRREWTAGDSASSLWEGSLRGTAGRMSIDCFSRAPPAPAVVGRGRGSSWRPALCWAKRRHACLIAAGVGGLPLLSTTPSFSSSLANAAHTNIPSRLAVVTTSKFCFSHRVRGER
jgi:hypothetical protein